LRKDSTVFSKFELVVRILRRTHKNMIELYYQGERKIIKGNTITTQTKLTQRKEEALVAFFDTGGRYFPGYQTLASSALQHTISVAL